MSVRIGTQSSGISFPVCIFSIYPPSSSMSSGVIPMNEKSSSPMDGNPLKFRREKPRNITSITMPTILIGSSNFFSAFAVTSSALFSFFWSFSICLCMPGMLNMLWDMRYSETIRITVDMKIPRIGFIRIDCIIV